MTEKRKAMLQIAGIVAVFVLLVVGTIFYKSLWLRIPFAIMAIGVGALLVRMYLSYKRKKYAIEGKVLSITPPKNRMAKFKFSNLAPNRGSVLRTRSTKANQRSSGVFPVTS